MNLLPDKIYIPPSWIYISYKYKSSNHGMYYASHEFMTQVNINPVFSINRQAQCIFHAVMDDILDTMIIKEYNNKLITEIYAIIRDNPLLIENKFTDYVHLYGNDYNIIFKNYLDGDKIGEIDYANSKINLYEKYPISKIITVLWHEILHTILTHLDLDEKFGEEFCNILARFITIVFAINDMKWLLF